MIKKTITNAKSDLHNAEPANKIIEQIEQLNKPFVELQKRISEPANKITKQFEPANKRFLELQKKISEPANKITKQFEQINKPFIAFIEAQQKLINFAKEYENDKQAVKNNIYVDYLVNDLDVLEHHNQYLTNKIATLENKLNAVINIVGKPTKAPSVKPPTVTRKIAKTPDLISIVIHLLPKLNNLLFDNSNVEQWETLLNGNTLREPIIIKKGVKIVDVRYFFTGLEGKYLIVSAYSMSFERQKALSYESNILKGRQLNEAKKAIYPKLKPDIDKLLELF